LYGAFIKQQKIETVSMSMSDTYTTRLHSGAASEAGSDYEAQYDGVVEDRFYNQDGYRTLSSEQKNELQLKRKLRGGDDNDRRKGNDRTSNDKRVHEDDRKKDKTYYQVLNPHHW
jgi:hypothetical protein